MRQSLSQQSIPQFVSYAKLQLQLLANYLSHGAFVFLNYNCSEHASHVAMSIDKLLKRIIADGQKSADAHDYTHGITSDPIAQFAIVLSALIHDADHQGISNTRLAQENPELAKKYRNQSLAEQNSL